jgi:hypothetical protein
VEYRKLFADIQSRPGMWGLDGSFGQFCAFVTGADAGNDWQLLTGFREWLVVRADAGNNLTWPALILRLAFPGVEIGQRERLTDPDGNTQAVDTLFALLAEFLDLRTPQGGTVAMFDEYLAWLKSQSWYRRTPDQ